MSYILNYAKWNKLFESRLLEGFTWADDLVPVTPGNEIKSTNDSYYTMDLDKLTDNEIMSTMTKIIGKESMPNLYVSKMGSTSITPGNHPDHIQRVFSAILQGIAQYSGDKTMFDTNDKIKALLPTLKLSQVQEGSVELIGPSEGKINTVGYTSGVSFNSVDIVKSSQLSQVCAYINGFNLQNWAAGSFTQYDPTKIVNGDKVVDLTKNGNATITEKGYLIFVTSATADVEEGSRETTTELTQGEEGKTGAVEIAFAVGKSDVDASNVKVDANHPKVKEIGDKITQYLGENGVIDKMTLTSSASPEYDSKNGGPAKLEDYAAKKKPTSGTTAPTALVDAYDKNAKLSYDRGVTFRNALIAYLGAHLKANSISVSWKISNDAPGNGKNISYNIATKSEAPAAIEKTVYRGAKTTITKGKNTMFIYKIKFNAAAVVDGGKRKSIAYETLEKGNVIVIKGTINGVVSDKLGDRKTVTVSKVEDNKVYFKATKTDEAGNEVTFDKFLDKARYIKLAEKEEKPQSEA
jgi:hypothetical protein